MWLIYDGLRLPTAIAFLGLNDMLVLEQDNNKVMRIVNGQMLDEPVLDLGNTITNMTCMCDIAILQNDTCRRWRWLTWRYPSVG
jgi:aldose sugar dehydrogenase